jgi:hypothetical protein
MKEDASERWERSGGEDMECQQPDVDVAKIPHRSRMNWR